MADAVEKNASRASEGSLQGIKVLWRTTVFEAVVESFQVLIGAFFIACIAIGGTYLPSSHGLAFASIRDVLHENVKHVNFSFLILAVGISGFPLLALSHKIFGEWFRLLAQRTLHFLSHILIGGVGLGIPFVFLDSFRFSTVVFGAAFFVYGCVVLLFSKLFSEEITFQGNLQLGFANFLGGALILCSIFGMPVSNRLLFN